MIKYMIDNNIKTNSVLKWAQRFAFNVIFDTRLNFNGHLSLSLSQLYFLLFKVYSS